MGWCIRIHPPDLAPKKNLCRDDEDASTHDSSPDQQCEGSNRRVEGDAQKTWSEGTWIGSFKYSPRDSPRGFQDPGTVEELDRERRSAH